MPRPLNLPEPFDTGPFAVRAAREADVPMSSLRALPSPFRGVRGSALPESITDRFTALRLVCLGELALSHCSAARVHGLPVPRTCEHEDLHVMASTHRVRRPGVVGHRGLATRERVTVASLPVTGLADTWIDLAPFVSLDDLVVLGDAVAQRLGGAEALRARVTRRVPGVSRARTALRWVRVGSASPMETRSRVLFGRAGLPEPELNVAIHDPEGGWLARGDLVWREARAVGEYQGADHFGDYSRGDKDLVRRRSVEAIGWTYIDFTKDDYYRRPRRVALVRRLAGALGCGLDEAVVDEVAAAPGLPGDPMRRCGG